MDVSFQIRRDLKNTKRIPYLLITVQDAKAQQLSLDQVNVRQEKLAQQIQRVRDEGDILEYVFVNSDKYGDIAANYKNSTGYSINRPPQSRLLTARGAVEESLSAIDNRLIAECLTFHSHRLQEASLNLETETYHISNEYRYFIALQDIFSLTRLIEAGDGRSSLLAAFLNGMKERLTNVMRDHSSWTLGSRGSGFEDEAVKLQFVKAAISIAQEEASLNKFMIALPKELCKISGRQLSEFRGKPDNFYQALKAHSQLLDSAVASLWLWTLDKKSDLSDLVLTSDSYLVLEDELSKAALLPSGFSRFDHAKAWEVISASVKELPKDLDLTPILEDVYGSMLLEIVLGILEHSTRKDSRTLDEDETTIALFNLSLAHSGSRSRLKLGNLSFLALRLLSLQT